MSLVAITWAWQHEDLDPTEKLVLLAIADSHNGETGLCCPSRRMLCRRACVSESTVKRALNSLEARGLIRRQRNFDEEGRQRSNDIELLLEGQVNLTQGGSAGGPPEGVTGDPGEGSTGGPPSTGRRNRKREPDTHAGPFKIAGVPTTSEERNKARAVLELWNATTGHSFTSSDWVRQIIGRMREHPELELADHERVIHAALANPWWNGAATPAVVYGSGAQFERTLAGANVGPAELARAGVSAEKFGKILARRIAG